MKKLITILAIMMVVFGFAFADDPSTTTGMEELKVTCKVTATEPTFTLYGSATSSTASTGTGMTAGAVVTEKNTSSTTIALADDAIIKGDVTIYCVVKQANDNVKSVTAYTLSVEATKLSDGTTTTGHTTAAPAVSTLTAITASNVTGARTTADGATVTYAGLDADAADLASFNVKWTKTDLVPGITYYAYITLTIATT